MPLNVLEQAERALVGLDASTLVALYATSFLLEDTPAGLRINTRLALQEYYQSLFNWPEVKFSNVTFFTLGERGAGQWTWEGRSRHSAEPFAIRGASLFRLSQDAIEEEIIFYDPRKAYA